MYVVPQHTATSATATVASDAIANDGASPRHVTTRGSASAVRRSALVSCIRDNLGAVCRSSFVA
jgi:hypothetical protein